jgi:hypothetical protein
MSMMVLARMPGGSPPAHGHHAARREAIMTTIYALTAPLIIGPRLAPAVRIAPGTDTGGIITAEILAYGEGPHALLRYAIDMPGGASYEGDDLKLAMLFTDDEDADIVARGIAVLCGFLGAEAEAYAGSGRMGTATPPDGWLFNPAVAEWAYLNADEIAALQEEIHIQQYGDLD